MNQRTEKIIHIAFFVLLFAALGIIFFLSPVNGDDWFFRTYHIDSFREILSVMKDQWVHLNGRILGNICSVVLANLPIARELIKTVIVFFSILLLEKLSFFSRGNRMLVVLMGIVVLVFSMPREIYRQTYAWMAGFYNYVPCVFLFLWYLYLIREHFHQKQLPNRASVSILAFGLGASACLFAENITIYLVVSSLGLLIWHFCEHRKLPWVMLSHFIGTVCGTAMMFLSPMYGKIATEGDSYRTMFKGLEGLLESAQLNYGTITHYMLRAQVVLLALVSVACIILLFSSKKPAGKLLRYFNCGLLVLGPVYSYLTKDLFYASLQFSDHTGRLFFDLAIWGLYLFAVFWSIARGDMDSSCRRRAVFFLLSMPVSVGALLVVRPIGPRCFYMCLIFLIAAVLNLWASLLSNQLKNSMLERILPAACTTLCAIVFITYGILYYQIYQAGQQRIQALEEGMAQGQTTIYIPRYPHTDFVHESNPMKMGEYQYYYETPGDIEIKEIYSEYR